MKRPNRTHVVVVGAGPVGMFAALCLRKLDLDVDIFDAMPRANMHSYTRALHPASLAILEEAGLRQALEKESHRIERVRIVLDGDTVREIHLRDADLAAPYAVVTGQDTLENTLEQALRLAGVGIHWNHRVTNLERTRYGVEVTARELEERTMGYAVGHTETLYGATREVECDFVIGADGSHSFVRGFLEIDFPEVAPAQQFETFEFSGSDGDPSTVELFLNRNLVSARWPLNRSAWRWSFEVPPEPFGSGERHGKLPGDLQGMENSSNDLDIQELRRLIAERTAGRTGEVDEFYWRVTTGFEKRLAPKFGEGRFWLAGDAAHLAGPVRSQSMNVGLREARELADRIAGILDMRKSLDALEDYSRERVGEWRFLLGLSGGLRALPGTDARLAAVGRSLLAWLPASGQELAEVARQLGLEVDREELVSDPFAG